MLDTEALNKYITLYQDAVATGKYKGGFYDYMKQNFGIDLTKTENITTNIPLTTTIVTGKQQLNNSNKLWHY